MTEDKARKRAIRSRMAKTGERYTAARRHVMKEPAEPARAPATVADPGMTDEAVERGTGKRWDRWFAILDGWSATERSHAEIARHLAEEHGLSGWWSQSVTVGYERARGMRRPHERGGTFQVGVSKTFPVDVVRLFRAVTDPRRRSRWLEPGTLRVRTSREARSARFDFRDGRTRVNVEFVAKGPAKATLQLQHERLPEPDAVEEMRAFWKERFARLADVLGV